jgi:Ribonucleotide reductase, barrel domain
MHVGPTARSVTEVRGRLRFRWQPANSGCLASSGAAQRCLLLPFVVSACEVSHILLGRYFDFDKLVEVTSQVARNLNKIIDVNYYPVKTAERSNLRHRPVGIGVQVRCRTCGLA